MIMSQILSTQVNRWCFTYNNYHVRFDYETHLKRAEFKLRRCVWGREICPTTGTPHLQGYLECFRSVRLGHVRKIFGSAYWEPARGSSVQNYQYCTKGIVFLSSLVVTNLEINCKNFTFTIMEMYFRIFLVFWEANRKCSVDSK